MAIMVFSPQSKAFVAKGNDGKFTPMSPIRVSGQGIVDVKGKVKATPKIISREQPDKEVK